MDNQIKAKWLEALRSGNYTQGRGALRNVCNGKSTFCCLGVLADILEPSGWRYDGEDAFHANGQGTSQSTMLNDQTLNRCGLTHSEAVGLSSANDEGRDFEYIADFIEAQL